MPNFVQIARSLAFLKKYFQDKNCSFYFKTVKKLTFFERLNFVQIARSLASFLEKAKFLRENCSLYFKSVKKVDSFWTAQFCTNYSFSCIFSRKSKVFYVSTYENISVFWRSAHDTRLNWNWTKKRKNYFLYIFVFAQYFSNELFWVPHVAEITKLTFYGFDFIDKSSWWKEVRKRRLSRCWLRLGSEIPLK